MAQDLNEVILKYEKFINLQSDKLCFMYKTLNLFKKKFIKNKDIEKKYFKNILKSIYNEIDLMQEILRTCSYDLDLFIKSSADIGCISFLKIKNLQFNIDFLSETQCNKCLEIIEICINYI